MTCDEVIKEYKQRKSHIYLDDEYLANHTSPPITRKDVPLVGEYEYGIASMRDDGVDLLIERIEELEKLYEDTAKYVFKRNREINTEKQQDGNKN